MRLVITSSSSALRRSVSSGTIESSLATVACGLSSAYERMLVALRKSVTTLREIKPLVDPFLLILHRLATTAKAALLQSLATEWRVALGDGLTNAWMIRLRLAYTTTNAVVKVRLGLTTKVWRVALRLAKLHSTRRRRRRRHRQVVAERLATVAVGRRLALALADTEAAEGELTTRRPPRRRLRRHRLIVVIVIRVASRGVVAVGRGGLALRERLVVAIGSGGWRRARLCRVDGQLRVPVLVAVSRLRLKLAGVGVAAGRVNLLVRKLLRRRLRVDEALRRRLRIDGRPVVRRRVL